MGKSGRTLLVALLALLVSPDVLGFSLSPAGARHMSRQRAARGTRSAAARPLSMASDPRFDSLVERVETAAKAPKEPVPVFKSQDAEAPATIAEVQQDVASTTTKVVTEQRPPSASAAGSGQAYDGAVSAGSLGLQVVEGLAVLAAVPAILTALNKQQAAEERKAKNQARADELAKGRQARADAKAAALAQAAIDRKEKQEGIAARIEAARIEEERQESVRQMVLEAQVKKQAEEAAAAKVAAEEAAKEKAASDARREASRLAREAKMAEKKAEEEAKAAAAAELKAKQEAEAKAAAEAAELKAKQEAEAKAAAEAAELKAKQEAEAKAAAEAAELKAKQEAEAKAAAELKAKQEAELQTAGLTARKLREQTNARNAADAEAKSADSAPKKASWTSTVAATSADGGGAAASASAAAGSAGGAAAATTLPGGGEAKPRVVRRAGKASPALAQARRNNAAKTEVLAILNKMDRDTLAGFGEEVGVNKGPASFDALRATIVKKLEEREGTWSEIAPEVAAIASKFATPA